jgi:hypothetical protein
MKNTLFTPNRRQLMVGVMALMSSDISWSQPSNGVLRIGYQK